jgi:hypothetical protein
MASIRIHNFYCTKILFNKLTISRISIIRIEPPSATMSLNNKIEHLHVSANDDHKKATNISKETLNIVHALDGIQ